MYYSLDQNTFYPYYTDEYAIIEELKKPEWEIISDSIKTIVNYQCVMAKTDLCGHKTIVWFTPDIPMSCGPWRLWGLPGLVVNAKSDDGKIYYQLTSMKPTKESPQKPNVNKIHTPQEFKTKMDEKIKKLTRELSGTGDRDVSVSFSIKCNYEYIDLCF